MTSVIEVQHLKKSFQSENALEDVSFSINKGEIFGFLGPSGSGKTTTIKILTAQLEETRWIGICFRTKCKRNEEKLKSKSFW